MDFKKELKEYQKYINEKLQESINYKKCPEEVLNASTEYSLMAGGKRIRPILILATYKMLCKDENCNYDKCLPYMISMEMIHNFSLIHDDLPGMDNDDLRHGKLTNHKAFNEATAILAGDKLLNGAYNNISTYICKKIEENKNVNNDIKAMQILTNATDRMIIGEYIDTESENKEIPIELLDYIHENKTGALIEASVKIGAIMAKASKEDFENVSNYARKIGLAFQIKDDILSEIGDEKIMGKPVGNDKKKKKSTYVSMYGLEVAQDILERITFEAVDSIHKYGEKAEFLKDLAMYIKDREK